MDSKRWEKIETVCIKAMGLEGEARTTYLKNACAGDQKLLDEVTGLLEQQHTDWLQEPLVQMQSSYIFLEDESLTDQVIGPYRIIKTIAEGGMGRVYLAVRNDDQFERFVALKVIRKGLISDDVLSRFYSERQILASLNHPHIARLYDGGTSEDAIPWFAMEYIEGQPITEYCNQNNLSVDAKIGLFLKVCSAVQSAHQNLVIHRDLKPANILITPDGTPKLLDFGIAKLMDMEQQSGQTLYQKRIMTPEYASPEQVRNGPVSTLSDVYTLGILLYELLTGTLPYSFEARTAAAIEEMVCNTLPVLPSKISGEKNLKGDLDSVILKALEKNPNNRYSAVEQLADDLRRFRQSLPVLAQKVSFKYRSRKFLTRHKWGASIATAIAILLISFAGVTFMQSKAIEARAVEAERQRDRAEGVSEFLIGLFESVDPSKAEDDSLTAIALLHRGANRVENELSGQPQVQANLYNVISDVYESLGMYEVGLELVQKAYDIQTKLYEGKHADIAYSLNAMGWLHFKIGDYTKAESLLKVALVMRRNLYEGPHLDISRSLNDLAVLKQAMDDFAATDTLLQEAIDIRKKLAGEQDQSVAVASFNYGALKYKLGDFAAAEKWVREAVNIFLLSLGEKDIRTANAMSGLASIILARDADKNMDEAEGLYRKALAIRIQLFGEEHPHVALSYTSLGNLLRHKHEFSEAEAMLLKALGLNKNLYDEGHISIAESKLYVGLLYEEMKNYTEAIKYYSEALIIYRDKFPNGHTRTADLLNYLGRIHMAAKKYDKAEPRLRNAFDLRKQLLGSNDARTISSIIKLGICLAKQGDVAEAKLLLVSGLEALKNSGDESEKLKSLAERTLAGL